MTVIAGKYTLGVYDTSERAIEVLDEICDEFMNANVGKGKEFRGNFPSGYFGGYVRNIIYEMPEV